MQGHLNVKLWLNHKISPSDSSESPSSPAVHLAWLTTH